MKDQLKKLLKKAAPYVGYPAFYLVVFALSAVFFFPYGELKDRIVYGFNAEQKKPGGQELQIDEMNASWFPGVKMKGVRILSAPAETTAPGSSSTPAVITVDEVKARLQLLPLLIGHQTVAFSIRGLGGRVDGDVMQASKEREIDTTIEEVDIGQVTPIAQAIGLPLEGKLSGTVKLTMPENKAAKASGTVNLEIILAIGDGKAKIKNMLALPKINVGTLTLAAEAKEGNLKITKISAGGKDIEIQGEGRVMLREQAMDSSVDVYLRFKVNDAYRSKNDITKSIFGAPGSSQPSVLELADPKVKKAKREDGFYAWHLRGTLGRLEFDPAPEFGGTAKK